MRNLFIRLTELEHQTLKEYSLKNNVTMSKVLKDAFFSKLEDEYDIESFDEGYASYLIDKKTYSSREIKEILEI